MGRTGSERSWQKRILILLEPFRAVIVSTHFEGPDYHDTMITPGRIIIVPIPLVSHGEMQYRLNHACVQVTTHELAVEMHRRAMSESIGASATTNKAAEAGSAEDSVACPAPEVRPQGIDGLLQVACCARSSAVQIKIPLNLILRRCCASRGEVRLWTPFDHSCHFQISRMVDSKWRMRSQEDHPAVVRCRTRKTCHSGNSSTFHGIHHF